jgi:hypothetical protein
MTRDRGFGVIPGTSRRNTEISRQDGETESLLKYGQVGLISTRQRAAMAG